MSNREESLDKQEERLEGHEDLADKRATLAEKRDERVEAHEVDLSAREGVLAQFKDQSFRRFLIVGVIGTLIAVSVLLAAILLHKVDFDMNKWGLFFNTWLPKSWACLTVIFLTLLSAEWGSTGHTIGTLLNIDQDSTSEDKRTACYFLLGLVYCTTQAVAGGL